MDSQQIPSLQDLEKLEKKLHRELIEVEINIYNTEKNYIKATVNNGNIFKGWDAGANASRPTNAVTATSGRGSRTAKNPNNEKLFFSLSSLSAPKTDNDCTSK